MEEGPRFRGSREGSFRGEGDLAPTRYEWGIGRGNHVLQTHLSEMWVGVTVLPLPLGFSQIVGASDFGRGGRLCMLCGVGCHGGGAEVSQLRRRELLGRRWFGTHEI